MIDHIILPANALTVFYIKFYWLKNSTKSPKVLKVKVKVVKIYRAVKTKAYRQVNVGIVAFYNKHTSTQLNSAQLYFRRTKNNNERAKLSGICLSGRRGGHSALTDTPGT